jgi:hypothetical protein
MPLLSHKVPTVSAAVKRHWRFCGSPADPVGIMPGGRRRVSKRPLSRECGWTPIGCDPASLSRSGRRSQLEERVMDADMFDRAEQPSLPRAVGLAHMPGGFGTDRGLRRSREGVKSRRHQTVVSPLSHTISGMGGAVGLEGSHAPVGAIVEVATVSQSNVFARRVDCASKISVRAATARSGDGQTTRCDARDGPNGIHAERHASRRSLTAAMPVTRADARSARAHNDACALWIHADRLGEAAGAAARAGGKAQRVG